MSSDTDSWETASDGLDTNSDSDSLQTTSDEGEEDNSGDLSHLGAAATVKVQATQQQSFHHVKKGSKRLAQQVLGTLRTSDHDLVPMSLQQEVRASHLQGGNETRVIQQNIIQVQQKFGDVTVQGTRNLTIGGTQNIGTPALEKQLTQTEKIQNRTKSRIESWVNGMVRTAALDKVMNKLNIGTMWITVKGSPGEGKTTVACMALRELHSTGRQVFQVTSPQEFSEVSSTCPQAVILLDDIFGNLEFHQAEWVRWKPVLNEIVDDKEHRSHEQGENTHMRGVTVILVGRDYVLSSAFGDMGRLSDFFTQDEYVVDMSHTVDREIKEKVAIYETISQASGIELNQDEIDKICHIRCPHGFPHVCRLFVTLCKKNSKITAESFFKTPLEFLNQTVEKLMKRELMLILFKEMIKCDGKVSIRGLTIPKRSCELIQVGSDLVGTYLRKEGDYFLFDHPSIYDSVAFHLCKLHPLFVIDNCNLSFIHERLRLEQSRDNTPSRESCLVVYIPRSYIGDLAKRFASEISNRHLLQVLSHKAFRDKDFIKEMMSQPTLTFTTFVQLTDSKTEESCLSLLASNKSPQLLMYIDNHTDMQMTQRDINTVLYGVCKYAASDVLKYLQETRDSLDINVQYGTKKQTPLMIGAETRDSQFVQDILSLNPDVNARDEWDTTAFHYLCKNGLASAVTQVIDRRVDINMKNMFRWSPLYYACSTKHTEVMKLLLDKGARVDGKAVETACVSGNMETVTMLFKRDATVNMETIEGTPLHSACFGGHLKVIRYLIDKGACVNTAGWSGRSPLHRACVCDKHQAVQCLLEHDAAIDSTDSEGNTPLHTAAGRGSKECVDVLVKAGADVNVQSKDAQTPLHMAVYYQVTFGVYLPDISVCQTLIRHRSDINKQDTKGNTPLHLLCCVDSDTEIYKDWPRQPASSYEDVYRTLVTLLIDHGADVNIQNNRGEQALRGWCQILVTRKKIKTEKYTKQGPV